MGKFSDSFKRQLGRDTGRAVSNFLFGDKHAAPVRVVREKNQIARERMEHEAHMNRVRMSAEVSIEKLRQKGLLDQERQQIEFQQSILDREAQSAAMEKIEGIAAIDFPESRVGIAKLLEAWEVLLFTSSPSENDSATNRHYKGLANKYLQGVLRLQRLGLSEEETEHYLMIIKRLKKIGYVQRNMPLYRQIIKNADPRTFWEKLHLFGSTASSKPASSGPKTSAPGASKDDASTPVPPVSRPEPRTRKQERIPDIPPVKTPVIPSPERQQPDKIQETKPKNDIDMNKTLEQNLRALWQKYDGKCKNQKLNEILARGFCYSGVEGEHPILVTGINPSYRQGDPAAANYVCDFDLQERIASGDSYFTTFANLFPVGRRHQMAYLDLLNFRETDQNSVWKFCKDPVGLPFIVDNLRVSQFAIEQIVRPRLIMVKNKGSWCFWGKDASEAGNIWLGYRLERVEQYPCGDLCRIIGLWEHPDRINGDTIFETHLKGTLILFTRDLTRASADERPTPELVERLCQMI